MRIVDLLLCFTVTLFVWYTLSPFLLILFFCVCFCFHSLRTKKLCNFLVLSDSCFCGWAAHNKNDIVIQSLCVKCHALQAADFSHQEAVSSSKGSNAHGKDEQHDSCTNVSPWKGQQSWSSLEGLSRKSTFVELCALSMWLGLDLMVGVQGPWK